MKRFIPNNPFSTRISGVRYVFTPDHVHFDGLLGYPELPKGMSKQLRDSFYVIDVDVPVEEATAKPGATRRTTPRKKPAAKKPAAKK